MTFSIDKSVLYLTVIRAILKLNLTHIYGITPSYFH